MNILVTGDIFRPSVVNGLVWPSQKTNIEKLSNIVSGALNGSKHKITVHSDGFCSSDFNVVKIYSEIGLSPGFESWAKIYDDFNYSSRSYEELINYFYTFDLVIGFELPQHLIRRFIKNKTPFVSFMNSPVRFLGERFYFDTNIIDLPNKIEINLKSEIYDKRVNSAALKIKLKNALNPLEIEQDSTAVICLQTLYDRVRIIEGRFLRVWDFPGEISQIAKKYKHIYIKKHPLEANPIEAIYLLGTLNSFRSSIIDDEIYRILSAKKILEVVSISSSACIEAKFFNKKSTFLYKDFYRINDCQPGFGLVRSFCGDSHKKANFWHTIVNV